MTIANLTARVIFAAQCVPADAKLFAAEVAKQREALKAEREAKLAKLQQAPKP